MPALPIEKIAAVRADYEIGIETKESIRLKHGLHTQTLYDYARKQNWEYGKHREAIEKKYVKKLTEKGMKEEVDRKIFEKVL